MAKRILAYTCTAVIICFSFCPRLYAATYYVDSREGNDRYTGSTSVKSATSDQGPLQSLEELTKRGLKEGDTVFLRCGSVWYGNYRIEPGRSSDGGNSLEIRSFGDDCWSRPPVIDGRARYADLSQDGEARFASRQGRVSAVVSKFGRLVDIGRYPTHVEMRFGPSGAYDRETGELDLPEGDEFGRRMNLVGAVVRAKTEDWTVEERFVVSHSGRRIKLHKPFHYLLKPNSEFYFYGLPWMADESGGSWAWVAGSDRKKIYVTDDLRRETGFSALVDRPVFQINGNILINGVSVRNSGGVGIEITGNRAEVSNVEIRDTVGDGLVLRTTEKGMIRNSHVENAGKDGIRIYGEGQFEITRNTLKNIGVSSRLPFTWAAINTTDMSQAGLVLIGGNRIERTGYGGIRVRYNATVKGNSIEAVCERLDDCGAIYMWEGSQLSHPSRNVVEGNWIRQVTGASAPTLFRSANRRMLVGVYVDEGSTDVVVRGNSISGVRQGIFIGNADGNRVENNRVENFEDCGVCLAAASKWGGVGQFESTVVSSNTLRYGRGHPISLRFSQPTKGPVFSDNVVTSTNSRSVLIRRSVTSETQEYFCEGNSPKGISCLQ